MLEELLHINPALYNQSIKTLKDFCRHLERKYNRIPEGEMGFRAFRPDDVFIGGTINKYTATYSALTEENIFGLSNERNYVPIMQGVVYFGWKCKIDLGKDGYVYFTHNGIEKRRLKSSLIYEQQYPQYTYYDIQGIHVFIENDLCSFKIYNSNEFDIFGEVYPILYIIASKRQLWGESDSGNEIKDWSKIDDNIDDAMKNQKDDIKLQNIEAMLTDIKQMYKPFDYVKIKDTPFSEHVEMKTRLDPSMKHYLESIKNGKVCQFCGEKIMGNAHFCRNCGCPVDYSKEKEVLHKELKK